MHMLLVEFGKKGLTYGKFIILNSNKELIWKGEVKHDS